MRCTLLAVEEALDEMAFDHDALAHSRYGFGQQLLGAASSLARQR